MPVIQAATGGPMPEPAVRAAPRLGRALAETLHLPALVLYSVLGFYAAVPNESEPGELLVPLAVTALAAVLMVAILWLPLGGPRRAALGASALLIAGHAFDWILVALLPGLGVPVPLASALLLIGAVALFLPIRRASPARIARAGRVLTLVILGLTIAALATGGPRLLGRLLAPALPPDLPLPVATRTTDRDIVVIVLDRYGSADALRTFGVEGRLPAALRARGFVVADGAHANYASTGVSLASALNLAHLPPLVEAAGADTGDFLLIRDLLDDHLAGRFLRAQGYRYHHVGTWYPATAGSAIADDGYRFPFPADLGAVLYDLSAPAILATALGATDLAPETWRHREAALGGLGALDALAGTIAAPGPDFVFAHVLLPHDPYVFAADGAPGDARTRTDLAAQLAYADTRVTALVDRLLDRPAGEAPIVAILADEGPYPPRPSRMADAFRWEDATPEEVAVKFGTLLALHLPDAPGATDPAGYPAGMPTSPVNLFRHLFARYFGTDTPPLADTVLASNGPSPLRFIDRTALLAEGRRILADGADVQPGG